MGGTVKRSSTARRRMKADSGATARIVRSHISLDQALRLFWALEEAGHPRRDGLQETARDDWTHLEGNVLTLGLGIVA